MEKIPSLKIDKQQTKMNKAIVLLCIYTWICYTLPVSAQMLPQESQSNWKSRRFMLPSGADNATVFEKSNGKKSSSPEELKAYLDQLKKSPLIKVREIAKSPDNNPVFAVFASTDAEFGTSKRKSEKPLLLFQGGIHAGEIDGMDAGLMILRDLTSGRLRKLLQQVNIIFIPVINPDGHARLSKENRINQRGPEEMGWRSNGLNQNLNRDYMKLDCPEIKALIDLINTYDPDLYIDIHVTDGTDYQYDITYGWNPIEGYSPGISYWMNQWIRPAIDKALNKEGHVPGPLIFQVDSEKPEAGITDYVFSPRFSNAYGDVIHLPSILVENHSLKSFNRRVCGTYVFLEAILEVLSEKGFVLREARKEAELKEYAELAVKRKINPKPADTILFKGIEIIQVRSELFNYSYLTWNGKPFDQQVPVFVNSLYDKKIPVAKSYIIPEKYTEIIDRIKAHGIEYEVLNEAVTFEQITYKMRQVKQSGDLPFQGRIRLNAETEAIAEKRSFKPGAIRIHTKQPKGLLAAMLLEPEFEDSFFSWGFFSDIVELTEYYEEYAMIPLAERMALEHPQLKKEFDAWLAENEEARKNVSKQIRWWYEHSTYFDKNYLTYPVGVIR